MSELPLWQRLNVFSHTQGFDTPNARLICEAADACQERDALRAVLTKLIESSGHLSSDLSTVKAVRQMAKYLKALDAAKKVLGSADAKA